MRALGALSRRVKHIVRVAMGRDVLVRRQIRCAVERHGSDYGGWVVCPVQLDRRSVVYSFGVGDDLSFDVSLIERYGLDVHAFDPTPRSIAWVRSQNLPDRLHFHDFGLADYDGEALFQAPEIPGHMSYTIAPGGGPDSNRVSGTVRRLPTIMEELGHDRIDVLKLDIEGAEYGVIDDLLEGGLGVRQLLVEFHHGLHGIHPKATRRALEALERYGYEIFFVSPGGREISFIRETNTAESYGERR